MANNPFKLTFTLKQHTPMIHFQHDQAGATLRATEVKPKLDAFLINEYLRIGDGKSAQETSFLDYYESAEDENLKGWVQSIKDGRVSLAYKLSISDKTEARDKKFTPNIKLITDPVHHSILSKRIKLSVVCMNESLRKFIKERMESFFVLHNFGTRQNKGWGSFTLEATKDVGAFKQALRSLGKICYEKTKLEERAPINGSWEQQIKIDHQRFKSGLNHPSFKSVLNNKNGYEKSKLFEYLNEKTKRDWDKKFLKQQIVKSNFHHKLYRKTTVMKETPESNEDNFVFIRALLGLAEHYEFQVDYNGQVDRTKKYKVKVDGRGVQRYKSPLTFKVFEGQLFVILEDMPDEIFDVPFDFSLGTRSKAMGRKEMDDTNFIKLTEIKTPLRSEFELDKFMSFCARQMNYVRF